MNGYTMTQGTPWKLTLKFALPVLLGILLQQLYNTVDTIIVGNYASETALSAVGTTNCLTLFFLALANGFSAGAGVIISQHFGANEKGKMRENAVCGLVLMLAMGLLSTFVGIALCKTVLANVLAVSGNMLTIAVSYFRWYCIGLIFQFGYNIVSAILRAVGDSRATLYFLLIASVMNILLDLLFVAVFKWGAAGAAIATDIAQAVSFIAALLYMNYRYSDFRFTPGDFFKEKNTWFDSSRIGNILRVGFPMALQQVVISFGFTFIQRAVNGFGEAMTASFTVGQRLEVYITMPANAFQVTMATFAGQNLGAGQSERVMSGAKQTIIMCEITTALLSVLSYIFANPIIGLFNLSTEASAYCVQHIRCTAIVMLLFALYFPLLGIFQGAKHGFAATVVALTALTIRVLTVYTLRNIPFFDYRIIWWNMLFGYIGGFLITWGYFLSKKWCQKKEAQL
ncbi:MAG: MATE family efflux transporter [Oscillospiraceae bacterium]|nr:MATE family efflux transporter [Oscillospiraceae bacterium]